MARMSMKLFKVWMAVLDHPNVWMDASDISECTDLTSRQVVSLMGEVYAPEVDREVTEVRPRQRICYVGSPEQNQEMRRKLMIARYEISKDHIRTVYNAMSSAGWTTVSDIAEETGMSKTSVSKVLKVMMPGTIHSKVTSTSTLYRREWM